MRKRSGWFLKCAELAVWIWKSHKMVPHHHAGVEYNFMLHILSYLCIYTENVEWGGGCFEWHFNTCLRYNSVNWSVAVGNSSSEVLDYHISCNKNILVSFPNCSWVAGKNWSVVIRFSSMTAVMWQLPSPSMSVCLFENERQLSNIISGNLRWPRGHKGSCWYTTAMEHQNSASEYVHNNFRAWVI